MQRVIQGRSPNPQAWSDADIDAFTRAAAGAGARPGQPQLYRTFLLKEIGPVAAGRYQKTRLTVPTRLLFGTNDFAISKTFFTRPTKEFADDFTIEFIPDTGHFIAEERPELVNDRALEFFGQT